MLVGIHTSSVVSRRSRFSSDSGSPEGLYSPRRRRQLRCIYCIHVLLLIDSFNLSQGNISNKQPPQEPQRETVNL